jgi:hypothetical protein
MTKDEYIQLRKQREIPIPIWFEFYKERGGLLDDIGEFEKVFTTVTVNQSIIATPSGAKQVTFKSALEHFYNYYNNKFGL